MCTSEFGSLVTVHGMYQFAPLYLSAAAQYVIESFSGGSRLWRLNGEADAR